MMQNLMFLALSAKLKAVDLLTDEKGEVNIVATVILIAIAVLLAVYFKREITDVVKGLFNTINPKVDGLKSDI